MYWPVAKLGAIALIPFLCDWFLTIRIMSGFDCMSPEIADDLLKERTACTKALFGRIYRNAIAAFFVVFFTDWINTAANVIAIVFIANSVLNTIGFVMDAISIIAKAHISHANPYVIPLQILWSLIMIACAVIGALYMLQLKP